MEDNNQGKRAELVNADKVQIRTWDILLVGQFKFNLRIFSFTKTALNG